MPLKTDKLNIRLSPVLKDALRDVAEKEHRSISNMIETMILERCRKAGINVGPTTGNQRKRSTPADGER